jgi:glutathione reductase (NADPH)
MSEGWDVIVLGAGNAGQGAAGVLREAGKSVAIVEERDVGGVCPLRGCVPKKVLVAAAEVLDVIARAGDQGVKVERASIDWPKLMGRKREILAGTSESMEKSLASRGIDLIRGSARFVAPDAIEVEGRRMSATTFVIATGSRPRTLPIPGAEHMKTSDDVLELDALPGSVAFIGAGVVALELSHVLARAGAKVTIIEAAARPLPALDADAVAQITAATTRIGVDVHVDAKVVSIEPGVVHWEDASGSHETRADMIVNGAGRVANLDSLNLGAAGVELDRGVRLGGPFQSATNPRVFVAGDALAGTPQLSPIATYEGRLVGRTILGAPVAAEYRSIPSCVYTIPTLATVGANEGKTVKVNDMTSWRSGRTYAEAFAWAKVVLDDDDKIIGAHLVGHGAAETIHAFAFAMRHGLRARDLKETVYAYPTFHADIKYLV